ncbi:MAG TPA: hypothetical protein VFC24_03345 [Casimicrobiaceae bacterium]|nr:hypothetical protein [Casimicrobiaceae bacterium]
MKRTVVQLLLSVIFLIALVPIASAQATRTWVSGVGDDANPCSRTAPCKTFAGAISKTAPGGEIDALDPGGFGALTITKPITIDGGGGQVASVLVAGTNGIVVAAGATDTVILRNLRFDGLLTPTNANAGLNGIRFISGLKLVIDRCDIFGFSQSGIDFESSTASPQLFVTNTNIVNAAGSSTAAGILVQAAGSTTSLDNVRVVQSSYGLYVRNGTVSVRQSAFSGNSGNNIRADSLGTVQVSLDNTLFSDSIAGTGIFAHASTTTVFLSNSSVTGNATGLTALSGAAINSYGNNRISGNTSSNGAPTATLPQQ